jgi:hypothetical protein
MSTELNCNIAPEVSATRFFGGTDRGACIQVTRPSHTEPAKFDHISFTREEAISAAKLLIDFATMTEEEA